MAQSAEKRVVVYTPESQLRNPVKLAQTLARDLMASRELAWRLMVRDLTARYRQSLMGFLWAFLPPVASALIFVLLNRQGVINVGDTGIPYPAFVMTGTVLWQLFVESLTTPMKVMNQSKSLIAKVNFPREALIISGIGQVLFEMGIRSIILAAIVIIFQIPPSWTWAAAPLAMLMIILLGITIGLFLVPIGSLYSDVNLGIGTLASLLMFLTPVIYQKPEDGTFALLLNLNPMTHLLVAARDLITLGTLTSPTGFFVVSGVVAFAALVAWLFYRVALPIITERIGA